MTPPAIETALPDLRSVPLGDLSALDDGALDEALRRILNRAPQAVPVAGFNSAI